MSQEWEPSFFYRRAEASDFITMQMFASSIEDLRLEEREIHGRVLVIGEGPAYPERLLLCEIHVPGHDDRLRRDITELHSADPTYLSQPDHWIDIPVTNAFDYTKPEPGAGVYYPVSVQEIMDSIPDGSFDTALMFRIPHFDEQLEDGVLLPGLSRILSPKGRFIATGSMPGTEYAERVLGAYFAVDRVAQLPSVDASGYYFYPAHVGVVAIKK